MSGAIPEVHQIIDCIDCGGRCHLMITWEEDDRPYAGDVVWYRCEDCNDRWDIVIPDDDGESPTAEETARW